MAENVVSIGEERGHTVAVSPGGRLLTSAVPDGYKFYFHTLIDAPGVAAANTFLSVFNPITSNKLVIFFQAEITAYAVAASGGGDSLVAYRITAASGGTEILPAQVNRFLTTEDDPQAQVRVGNPTVTITGLGLNSWQPPQTTGVGGATAATTQAPGEGFVCLPGQGIAFRTASGDTDQRWKVNAIWAEVEI